MNLVQGPVGIVKLPLKAFCASYLSKKLAPIRHVLGTIRCLKQVTELGLRLGGLVVVPKLIEVKDLGVDNLGVNFQPPPSC